MKMSKSKNINEDQHQENRLKSLAGNKNPFQVPDGYFDNLPDHLIQVVKENSNQKKNYFQQIPTFTRYAAAAIVIIMVAWSMVYLFNGVEGSSEEMLTFTHGEIYQYNFNNLAQLEEVYLLSLIESESFEDLSISSIDNADLTDDEIIDYLLSENHIEYHAITGY
jgi:hypothetical protein